MFRFITLALVALGIVACGSASNGTMSPSPATDAGTDVARECQEDRFGEGCASSYHCESGDPIPMVEHCVGGHWVCSIDTRQPICAMAPIQMEEQGHVFVACSGPPNGSLAFLDYETFIAGRMSILAYGRSLEMRRLQMGLRFTSGDGVVAAEGGVPYFTRFRALNSLTGEIMAGPVGLTNVSEDRRFGAFIFTGMSMIPRNQVMQLDFGLTIAAEERRYGDVSRSSYALRYGTVDRVFENADLRWIDGSSVTEDQVTYDPNCFDRVGAGIMGQFRVLYRGADLMVDLDTSVLLGDRAIPSRLAVLALRTDNFGLASGQLARGYLLAVAHLDGDVTRPIAFNSIASACRVIGNGGMVLSEARVTGDAIETGLLSDEAAALNGRTFSRLECDLIWPTGLTASYIDIRIGATPDGFVARASSTGESARAVGSSILAQNLLAVSPLAVGLRVRHATP